MRRTPRRQLCSVLVATLTLIVCVFALVFPPGSLPDPRQMAEISSAVDGDLEEPGPEPELIDPRLSAAGQAISLVRSDALTHDRAGYALLLDGRKRYKPPRA